MAKKKQIFSYLLFLAIPKVQKEPVITVAVLFFLINKVYDEFWFREYTYTLDGFYEDSYNSEDIKSSVFDGIYALEDLSDKEIVLKNGHYITIKANSSNSKNARIRVKMKHSQKNGQLTGIGCYYDNTYYTLCRNHIKKYFSLECVIPQAEETTFYIFNYSADPITFEKLSVKFY